MQKNSSEGNKQARELWNARKGYGAYCSKSGEFYFKNLGSKKVIHVSGTTATKKAVSNKAKPQPNVTLHSSGEGPSNTQPSYARSTISSRAQSAPGVGEMSARGSGGGIQMRVLLESDKF